MRLRLAVRRRVRFCSAQAKRKQIQRRDRIFTFGSRYKFSNPQHAKEVKMLYISW